MHKHKIEDYISGGEIQYKRTEKEEQSSDEVNIRNAKSAEQVQLDKRWKGPTLYSLCAELTTAHSLRWPITKENTARNQEACCLRMNIAEKTKI